ncbi:hypothetical protein HOK31_11785, partial [Candidatus Poribacteria bacterium]|nr:hypothetical protein [Candidatus Poribacteria bacterium]
MRRWWTDVTVVSVLLAATLFACSGGTPAQPAPEPPAELSTDDMLVAIATALAGGDVIEATRLAETVEARETTPKQTQMLRLLGARFGESDPTATPPPSARPRPKPADAWGASIARIRRPVPDTQIDTAGYDDLPFFHGYREAASCCQHALFDFGEVTVTQTDGPPPVEDAAREDERVIVFDFGEFLRRAGIDSRRSVYHGETRVRDGRLWHWYEDVTGGYVVGVTESDG